MNQAEQLEQMHQDYLALKKRKRQELINEFLATQSDELPTVQWQASNRFICKEVLERFTAFLEAKGL